MRAEHIYPSVKDLSLSRGSSSGSTSAGGAKKIAATNISGPGKNCRAFNKPPRDQPENAAHRLDRNVRKPGLPQQAIEREASEAAVIVGLLVLLPLQAARPAGIGPRAPARGRARTSRARDADVLQRDDVDGRLKRGVGEGKRLQIAQHVEPRVVPSVIADAQIQPAVSLRREVVLMCGLARSGVQNASPARQCCAKFATASSIDASKCIT